MTSTALPSFVTPLIGIGVGLVFGVPLLQAVYTMFKRSTASKSDLVLDDTFATKTKADRRKRKAGGYETHEEREDREEAEKFGSGLTKFLKKMRMLVCPVASVALTWFMFLNQSTFLRIVPAVFRDYSAASLVKMLPIHPRNMLDAFNFGRLVQQAQSNTAPVAEILANATAIAGRNVSSIVELLAVEEEIVRLTTGTSIIGKIWGAFTFVNIIWGVSILGITLLASPFLAIIAKPIVVALANAVAWTFTNILYPLAKALIPVYEPLAYLVAFFVQVEALRYPQDYLSTTGMMLGFTALVVHTASWFYSVYRHSTGGGDVEVFTFVTSVLLAAVAAPTAIAHRSVFLGYVTIAAVTSALGFSMWSNRWCTYLGFHSRYAAKRTAFATFAMTLIHVTIRFFNLVPREQLAPFESALCVLGSSIYFLALMCASIRDDLPFCIWYGASIVAYLWIGETMDMPGMSNVAKTYAGLWVSIFMGTTFPKRGDAAILWGMGMFVGLFCLSMYLHRNPIYMATLFNPHAAWTVSPVAVASS